MNHQITKPIWALVIRNSLAILAWLLVISASARPLDGFRPSASFDEQIREQTIDDVRKLVDAIAHEIPGKSSIVLSGHSGGGSFISGYVNSADTIDDRVVRIAYLDANYSFSNDEHHGEKLLAWLKLDRAHQLVVFAYDD